MSEEEAPIELTELGAIKTVEEWYDNLPPKEQETFRRRMTIRLAQGEDMATQPMPPTHPVDPEPTRPLNPPPPPPPPPNPN